MHDSESRHQISSTWWNSRPYSNIFYRSHQEIRCPLVRLILELVELFESDQIYDLKSFYKYHHLSNRSNHSREFDLGQNTPGFFHWHRPLFRSLSRCWTNSSSIYQIHHQSKINLSLIFIYQNPYQLSLHLVDVLQLLVPAGVQIGDWANGLSTGGDCDDSEKSELKPKTER